MTPTPIILDCDPGHDDAIAILLALASPELELLAITTVSGNQTVDKTTANALKVLELAGRSDIPVYQGAERPFIRDRDVAAHVHGESGLDGPDLPEPTAHAQAQPAVEFLAGELRRREGKFTLVATGPLTNIGLLFSLHPDARPERIVLMGGAIGEGNRTPAAEFNIWADPEAAERVFAERLDTTMVGLDVTHRALIKDEHTERLRGDRAARWAGVRPARGADAQGHGGARAAIRGRAAGRRDRAHAARHARRRPLRRRSLAAARRGRLAMDRGRHALRGARRAGARRRVHQGA